MSHVPNEIVADCLRSVFYVILKDATAATLQCLRKIGLETIHKDEPKCAKYIHQQVQDTNIVAGAGAAVIKACRADIKVRLYTAFISAPRSPCRL